MANGIGRAPSETLGEVFEQYMEEARRKKPVWLSHAKGLPPVHFERHSEGKVASDTNLAPLYQFQQVLRPIFGKPGLREPDIGDHPDFDHLKGTDDRVYCAVTTMFMDIEGSTRLGLLYSPEDVYRIKNAFIRAAIEVITSFNGHVHRIMGDAVMAYFGGCNVDPQLSAIDGLNCASVLRALAERLIAPKLTQLGFDHDFGIRIGLDYGAETDVLWSAYGYPKSEEVTATSFFVDVAAKLQHTAGRNQIMIGDSIKTFLDLPEDLLSVRTVTEAGKQVTIPFVTPNHTKADGKPVNYKQHIFCGDDFLEIGALGQADRKLLGISTANQKWVPLKIDADICTQRRGPNTVPYAPCSAPLPKNYWVRFIPRIGFLPQLPYTVRCSAINHGQEALDLAGPDRGSHSETHTVTTEREHKNFEHWERTLYRGLHFMKIDIRNKSSHWQGSVGLFVA